MNDRQQLEFQRQVTDRPEVKIETPIYRNLNISFYEDKLPFAQEKASRISIEKYKLLIVELICKISFSSGFVPYFLFHCFFKVIHATGKATKFSGIIGEFLIFML